MLQRAFARLQDTVDHMLPPAPMGYDGVKPLESLQHIYVLLAADDESLNHTTDES